MRIINFLQNLNHSYYAEDIEIENKKHEEKVVKQKTEEMED